MKIYEIQKYDQNLFSTKQLFKFLTFMCLSPSPWFMSPGVKLHIGPIQLHCILGQGGEIDSDFTNSAVWMLRAGFLVNFFYVFDDFTKLNWPFRVTVNLTWKSAYIKEFKLKKCTKLPVIGWCKEYYFFVVIIGVSRGFPIIRKICINCSSSPKLCSAEFLKLAGAKPS